MDVVTATLKAERDAFAALLGLAGVEEDLGHDGVALDVLGVLLEQS